MNDSGKLIVVSLPGAVLLSACAGSAPDFSDRTRGGIDQEAKLAELIGGVDKTNQGEGSQKIIVPLCSSTVGKPKTGWAIDGGNWCAVACNYKSVESVRWVTGSDGSRCLSSPTSGATKQVEVDFNWGDLSLEQSGLFKGLSRAFLSDTEWHCKEYSYLIDPDKNTGFWSELVRGNVIYRFHRDGKLLTGESLGLMKLAGSWQVNSQNQAFFNSTEVFKFAIDYGGGRFDNFKTATNKEVCRFVREAG